MPETGYKFWPKFRPLFKSL